MALLEPNEEGPPVCSICGKPVEENKDFVPLARWYRTSGILHLKCIGLPRRKENATR